MYVVYFYCTLSRGTFYGLPIVYETKPYISYHHGSEWMVPGTCDD